MSSLQRTSCDRLPGSLDSAPEQGIGRVLCRLLPAGEPAGLALSCQSPACVAQPRGHGLTRGPPHSLLPACLEPSSCCWDVPYSSGTGEVAEIVVLNGDGTCVLSGVLALHQAQRGFSSGQGTAVTGALGWVQLLSRAGSSSVPSMVPESCCWSRLALPSCIPKFQVWECEGSTWLCLSPEPWGCPWVTAQVSVPTGHDTFPP